MEQMVNAITLRGTLGEYPAFSHENHGRRFYRFTLEVPRLSGTVDVLPVIAEEGVLNSVEVCDGSCLTVVGQVRSHNSRSDSGRRLLIFVFATELRMEDGEPLNDCTLEGLLCREPVYRRTPLGREICDVMLAVPRAFHRADYLPCILWGRTAQEISHCHVRDRVLICGRLQSRSYMKQTQDGPQRRIAYEVSALTAHMQDTWEE